MRSAKSLISGFGVAISLVGAVACAFFITAALVAFHGSLDSSPSYQPEATVLAASTRHTPPIVIAAVTRPIVTAPPAATRTLPVGPSLSAVVASPPQSRTATTVVTTDPPGPKTPGPAPKAPSPPKTSTTGPLANATAGLANALGGVVADATGSLGQTVAPLSPSLGGTLTAVGTGLANGVVALGNAVAAAVTSLGAQPAAPQS
ncbi:MAG TPA: hypothetical protein VG165_04050 [Solirubrobacteraceae bacterium]|jgi:hypothetical protein|nr:hypothetical protein [Solirubrobacteraceae bacterium]